MKIFLKLQKEKEELHKWNTNHTKNFVDVVYLMMDVFILFFVVLTPYVLITISPDIFSKTFQIFLSVAILVVGDLVSFIINKEDFQRWHFVFYPFFIFSYLKCKVFFFLRKVFHYLFKFKFLSSKIVLNFNLINKSINYLTNNPLKERKNSILLNSLEKKQQSNNLKN